MSIITNVTNINVIWYINQYHIFIQRKGYKFDNNAYIKYVSTDKDLLLLRQSLRIKRC